MTTHMPHDGPVFRLNPRPYDLGKAIADRTEVKSIVNLRIVGTQWKGMKQMVLSASKQTSGADPVLNL
ncbi:hypothetical protein ACHAPC_003018 [Botrytis cinerea]|uniref:Uncharacterized protein n=1 Tax=Botryotinia fuckeliana (strain T4) TaxID=999810 RepID=G2YAR6_BOTF4|nr:predicted protein [Botrytis cinerea T4]